MKKITRFFTLMIVSACACCMTACLGDDQDLESNVYTSAEAAQILRQMKGDYNGTFYIQYVEQTAESGIKRDSVLNVPLRLTDTDSIAHMYFPVKLLAKAISGNDKVKEAVAALDAQAFDIKVVLVKTTSSQYYAYYPVPLDNFTFNVNYEDKTHEVTLTFTSSLYHNYQYYYAQGQYYIADKAIAFYLLPRQMTLDGTTTVSLVSCPMLYVGE